jgi:predicted dinucleotide-binding enzyme
VFGSRHPQSPEVRKLLEETGGKARAASVREAAASSEVVALAVPWTAARQSVEEAGDLSGKVLIDCTNPYNPKTGNLDFTSTTSCAEQVAGWARGARVVKDFNARGAPRFAHPTVGGQQASMFLCGDDAAAKAVASKLTAELGFDVVDCGPLTSARFLEPLCALWIQIAPSAQWQLAFRVLRG